MKGRAIDLPIPAQGEKIRKVYKKMEADGWNRDALFASALCCKE